MILLGLILGIPPFENGLGIVSLSASWPSVIRGAFPLVVAQAKLVARGARPGEGRPGGASPPASPVTVGSRAALAPGP